MIAQNGVNRLKIRVLESTSQSIVYEPPLGKPDPRLPCVEGCEVRPRVLQSNSKGRTCFYYALNYIRPRIGKFPTTEALKEARKWEEIGSAWRKKQLIFDHAFPMGVNDFFREEVKHQLLQDHASVLHYLQSGKADQDDQNLTQEGKISFIPYFKSFLQQNRYAIFYDFMLAEFVRRMMEINRGFLFQVNPQMLAELETRWKQLKNPNLLVQAKEMASVARAQLVKCYPVSHSQWRPEWGIKNLILKLKEEGPIVVCGKLGVGEYVDPPFKLPIQFAERAVFGWKKGATRRDVGYQGHAIVLVGAKYENSIEQVYYIDVNDVSDPANPALQKIYAISYRTLVAGMTNFYGDSALEAKYGFAMHGLFQIQSN